jgi:chromosome segregation and condensation protein ScpB
MGETMRTILNNLLIIQKIIRSTTRLDSQQKPQHIVTTPCWISEHSLRNTYPLPRLSFLS